MMLDWNEYRKRLAATVAETGKLSAAPYAAMSSSMHSAPERAARRESEEQIRRDAPANARAGSYCPGSADFRNG